MFISREATNLWKLSKTLINCTINSNIISIRSMCTPSCFSPEEFTIDKYRCAKVNVDKVVSSNPQLLTDPNHLLTLMKGTHGIWAKDGVRAIWFTIKTDHSVLVPVLIQSGFDYHHAKAGSVTLYKWIKQDEPNNIPSYPFTNIGVGGLVVNSKDEVLVVKEKYHLGYPLWKFPGGYAMKGEELGDTAVREVLEETGIRTKFDFMIALRHSHRFQFECSDMYFVAFLRPDEEGSLTPVRGLHEISDVTWMKHQELAPQLSPFNSFILQQYLRIRDNQVQMRCQKMDTIIGSVNVYFVGTSSSEDSS